MINRRRPFIALAALILGACTHSVPAPSSPEPVLTPEAEPQPAKPSSSKGSIWQFVPTADVQSYSSVVTTIVTSMNAEHPRRDSLVTQTSYSISKSRSADSLVYSGLIRTFDVKGTISLPESLSLVQPIPFSGTVTNHRIKSIAVSNSSTAEQTQCTDFSQIPIRTIERNLFFIPLTIGASQEWTDSTSSIACIGSTALDLTTLRVFHLAGETAYEGVTALAIDLNERTLSRGEGSQGQHQIQIQSEGQTKGRFYIDPLSGKVLGSNSTNKTSLIIRSSGRDQRFTENSTEITTRDR